ncbi:hypothetical protein PHYSODRAFT_477112, partial [Phytophthora sojae]
MASSHDNAAHAYSSTASQNLVSLSRESAITIQHELELRLLRDEARISQLHRHWGLRRSHPTSADKSVIDMVACRSLSEIIRSRQLSVEDAAKVLRGETLPDCRPNKALDPDRLRYVLRGYPHLDLLINIATKGIEAQWGDGPIPVRPPPKNHGSCRRHLKAVGKSIRAGQDSGQYMVVDADILERWSNVICSPLGAVEKKDVDPSVEVRTIHDLSY